MFCLIQAGSSCPVKHMSKTHMSTSTMPLLGVRTVAMTYVWRKIHDYVSLKFLPLQYATATFKVLFAYSGWQNVNYVLNEVKNPIRTLKIAGPLGLGLCASLYLLANVAYFAYVIVVQFRQCAYLYFKVRRARRKSGIRG